MKNLKQHLALFAQCAKYEVMDRLDAAAAFTIGTFGVVVNILIITAFFGALYLRTDRIGGWNEGQVLILLGTYFLIDTVAWGTYVRGFAKLWRYIEYGDLDVYLTKPVRLRTFFSYRFMDPLFVWPQLLAAVGLIIYGAGRSGASPHPFYYLLVLSCAIAIHRSLTVIFSSLNFYYIVPQSVYLQNELFKLGRYPITIYRGAVRMFLSIAIPVAAIFSFPPRALVGDLSPLEAGGAVLLTTVFYLLSNVVWDAGLKRYESAQG
jgi:ABC-2 type transport system permease protein